jgi:hypothetical protein
MKTKKTVEIEEVTCDTCPKTCTKYATIYTADRQVERHFCQPCVEAMAKQLGLTVIDTSEWSRLIKEASRDAAKGTGYPKPTIARPIQPHNPQWPTPHQWRPPTTCGGVVR